MQLPFLPLGKPRSSALGRGKRRLSEGREVDVRGLEKALRRYVDAEVGFDETSRALFSTDASNFRQMPLAVIKPRTTEAVVDTVGICREFGATITSRGTGTSLNGQACNDGVIIDFAKHLNRILDIDLRQKTARIQPGVICDQLRRPLEEKHGLTYGADPATHEYCTFGGMLGNNSCGVHSLIPARIHRLGEREIPGGRTSDCVIDLEVLTYDGLRLRGGDTPERLLERLAQFQGRIGEIYRGLRAIRDRYAPLIRERYPAIPRRVSGYNLDDLLPENGFNVARSLVGSEGTCVIILDATVQLVDWPRSRSLLVIGYNDVYEAADHVPELLEYEPLGLEGMDDRLVEFMRQKTLHPQSIEKLPRGHGWLLVEFGDREDGKMHEKLERCLKSLKRGRLKPVDWKVFADPDEANDIWDVRESGLAATAFAEGMPDSWEGWEDAAVPPERLGEYLRAFRALLRQHGYECALYGHFGQGCVHTRIDFGLQSQREVDRYRAFLEDASDLVVEFGGSFSAEHGDGQAKGVFLRKLFGDELMQAMREFKQLWDPEWKMNPGKLIDADDPVEHLRLGANYEPWEPHTHFQWPEDNGKFSRAVLRCVGVGKCRRTDNAFMCPSFLVTNDEKHTTRGRARALFEMLNGGVEGGWRSESVLEALDLCLGCKGCKTECPVNVDMAQYKSEFLSHHYEGRLRPRAAYSMGLIGWWAKIMSRTPGLANLLSQMPGTSQLAKALAGISQHRSIPPFAAEPFTRWFERRIKSRANRQASGRAMMLYPDTFNNYFYPDTLIAAVEALERLGYRPQIPAHRPAEVRPMIHYGLLPLAKRELRAEIKRLGPIVRAGLPIICLEPGSVSVFRDEVPNLFPDDQEAQLVSENVLLLSEFLIREDIELPTLRRSAILHEHCHQKAVLDGDAMRQVLKRMQIGFREPEIGCCGMAGSFGLESDHYDVSQKIAERHLLPAVRAAASDELIIAEGFSCRQQISEGTHGQRHAIHLSQLLRMALELAPAGALPERRAMRERRPSLAPAAVGLTLVAAGAAVGIAWLMKRAQRTTG